MGARIRGLILLLVIAAAIFVAYRMIPPYFNNYQLQDDLDDAARAATYRVISDDDLKAQVIAKAEKEDIFIKADQVTLTRTSGALGISVHYKVTVDLLLRTVELNFTANSLNKRL
ncbi:MAG TPA: hypothetical protein VN176_04940 [Verrucomicrobiae bacterium]|jgi:hypothetical protein|nr:hypothetical protein [Verrucomicrobiae bacterium]